MSAKRRLDTKRPPLRLIEVSEAMELSTLDPRKAWRRLTARVDAIEEHGGWRSYVTVFAFYTLAAPFMFAMYLIAAVAICAAGPLVVVAIVALGSLLGLWPSPF